MQLLLQVVYTELKHVQGCRARLAKHGLISWVLVGSSGVEKCEGGCRGALEKFCTERNIAGRTFSTSGHSVLHTESTFSLPASSSSFKYALRKKVRKKGPYETSGTWAHTTPSTFHFFFTVRSYLKGVAVLAVLATLQLSLALAVLVHFHLQVPHDVLVGCDGMQHATAL
jgi:hypothetical protein